MLITCLFIGETTYSQATSCDDDVPYFRIDLRSHPDTIWTSPYHSRLGQCCSNDQLGNRCTSFEILTEVSLDFLSFEIAEGASPSGSMYYQIDCGPRIPVGEPISISEPGTHTIVFCKPGNNKNSYRITSKQNLTKLIEPDCDVLLEDLFQVLRAVPIDGAEDYLFEVRDLVDQSVEVVNSLDDPDRFKMGWVPNIKFDREYSVRVKYKFNGEWSPYGAACSVTTPSPLLLKLQEPYCDAEVAIQEKIASESFVLASDYAFEVTDQVDKTVEVINSPLYTSRFKMELFSNVQFGRSYSVRVKYLFNGEWSEYGEACLVTTVEQTLIKLFEPYCGATVSMNQKISSEPFDLATDFAFEVTDILDSTVEVINSPFETSRFKMEMVSNVKFDRTYSVRVKYFFNGIWSDYGEACLVTTSEPILLKLYYPYCDITATLTQKLASEPFSLATDFAFEVTDLVENSVELVNSPIETSRFKMEMVPNVQLDRTYSVRVQYLFNGLWSEFGEACEITTSGDNLKSLVGFVEDDEEDEEVFQTSTIANTSLSEIQVYPNPNPGESINILAKGLNSDSELIEISIMDLYGKIIFFKSLYSDSPEVLQEITFDKPLAVGIYLLQFKKGATRITQKVVIN